MHLVDELVLGVCESLHVVVDIGPRPRSRPLVAFNKDVLLGTSGTDTVDSSLVKLQNQSLVHAVVFVVGVKDDTVVVLEDGSKVLPPSLESRRIGDDVAKEAAVVVGIKDSIGTLLGDVVDDLAVAVEVSLVVATSQGARQPLHLELHTEGVVSLADQSLTGHVSLRLQLVFSDNTYVDRSSVREGVILAQGTRQVALSKLTASLIGADPDKLASRWVGVNGGRRALLSGSRESSGRRVGAWWVGAWHTLAVIGVDSGACVARDASGRAAPVLASALPPGSALGQSEASEAVDGDEIAHGV